MFACVFREQTAAEAFQRQKKHSLFKITFKVYSKKKKKKKPSGKYMTSCHTQRGHKLE